MSISETFLPQFDHEMQLTRSCLANVPADKMAYKPHEKSMAMGRLSSHIADMVSWTNTIIDTEEFDIAPPGGKPREVHDAETTEELLVVFDKAVAAAHTAIASVSDETLRALGLSSTAAKPWCRCRESRVCTPSSSAISFITEGS